MLRSARAGMPTMFFLILVIACNSPESQLADLQHEFLQQFGSPESYEVRLSRQNLYLPLPAVSAGPQSGVEALRQKAEAIPAEKLDPPRKSQLELLHSALKEAQAGKGGLFDPTRYAVLEALQACASKDDLELLLEKIPEYYRQVEARWQAPSYKLAEKAVDKSQATLDWLEKVEIQSDKAQAARASIKDYIGLCRSAWLE